MATAINSIRYGLCVLALAAAAFSLGSHVAPLIPSVF